MSAAEAGEGLLPGAVDSRQRTALLVSIAAGIVVALVVGLVGIAYAKSRPEQYEATASVVLLPATNLDGPGAISALDALSRGQIVNTFARVLGGEDLLGPAVNLVAADGHDAAKASVEFKPVPNTSVVDIVVTSPTAFVSEHVAAEIATLSAGAQPSLQPLFRAQVVSRGAGSATQTGAKKSSLILAFLIAAVALGIVTQQLVMRLLASSRFALSWSRSPRPEPETPRETPRETANAPMPAVPRTPGPKPSAVRERSGTQSDSATTPPARRDAAPSASTSASADDGGSNGSPTTAPQKAGAGRAQKQRRPPRSETVEPRPKTP